MGDAVRDIVKAGVEHVRRDVAALVARVGIDADAGHAVGEGQALARGKVEFVGVPFARVEPHAAQQEMRRTRLCRLADVGVYGLRGVAARETGPERIGGIDGVCAGYGNVEARPCHLPAVGIRLPRGTEVGRRDDHEVCRAVGHAGTHKQCE